jgi:hypothetical protein
MDAPDPGLWPGSQLRRAGSHTALGWWAIDLPSRSAARPLHDRWPFYPEVNHHRGTAAAMGGGLPFRRAGLAPCPGRGVRMLSSCFSPAAFRSPVL